MYKIIKSYLFILLSSVIAMAQSIQELNKLKEEFEKAQKDRSSIMFENQEDFKTKDIYNPRIIDISPYEDKNNIDNNDITLKHYGYSFFTMRDTVSFWENLPVPNNYILGPGDELIISIWGETQLSENYTINRDGNFFDEKVGILSISGKEINDAKKYLKTKYSSVYATLSANPPSSFLDISLGQLKLINVNFAGDVRFPGVYPIHPASNLITGLIHAGGVDTTGSLRNIKIIRNGTKDRSVDLYEFFNSGSLPKNIELKDQDVVFVPPRKSIITVDSAVTRPGYYESIEGESVYDMIVHAGGVIPNAEKRLALKRLNENGAQSNYQTLYLDFEKAKSFPIGKADKIYINQKFDEKYQVELIGQVKRPGTYYFFEGMTLDDLLDLGGGLNDSTFINSIYLNQAEIIRKNPLNRYDEVLSINLNKDLDEKLKLKNLDKVVIHANLNFFEEEYITILGEVNIPGKYPLIRDNESLGSVIFRAGGLTSKALDNGILIYRNKKYFLNRSEIINQQTKSNSKSQNQTDFDVPDLNFSTVDNEKIRVAWQSDKIALFPSDSIIVKQKTSTVYVTGEVYNPGIIEFKKGKTISYYINAAGGVNELGNRNGVIIFYANGVVSPNKWYNRPKVLDGSTIVVNKKPIEQPFDITQFATNWSSIISSMITAIVLSQQLKI